MQSNRLSLLGLQGFASLGAAMVGVFFPFLLGEAFGLSFVSILIWGGCFHLSVGLSCEPINRLTQRWLCPKQKILAGLFLQAVFYALLGQDLVNPIWLGISSLVFLLHMVLYWPSFHAAIFWSTQTGSRGSFLGTIQALLIGVNIIAPIISGWLLDRNAGGWISIIAVIFFVLALLIGTKIQLPKNFARNQSTKSRIYAPLPSKNILKAFIADGVQVGVMWLIWPIFLRALGLSFVQIGFIMAFAALVEIFVSKLFGYWSDKYDSQYLLHRYGIWARLLDLGGRSVLFFVTQPWILAVVGGVSGLLGPVFQIPMYTRMHQHVQAQLKKNDSEIIIFNKALNFFMARERILGLARFVTLVSAGVLYYFFGLVVLLFFLGFAGLCSFGFRRF